jgi:hypothetical protein
MMLQSEVCLMENQRQHTLRLEALCSVPSTFWAVIDPTRSFGLSVAGRCLRYALSSSAFSASFVFSRIHSPSVVCTAQRVSDGRPIAGVRHGSWRRERLG